MYAFICTYTWIQSDLTENFRKHFCFGTAHVLAVSGLHVGIIYIVISMIFSFLGNRGNHIFTSVLNYLYFGVMFFIAGMSACNKSNYVDN